MHEGHRERLRKKFLKDHSNGLEKHEMLEMVLFYAVPRKNTNEIAHALIKRFNSISSLLEASIEDISEVEGMGINSAILIKTYIEIMRIYLEEKNDKRSKTLMFEDICSILRIKFLGKIKESMFLFLLDAKTQLMYLDFVREGNVNSIDIYIDEIVRLALKYKAVYAIIAHNHPSGILLPSCNDLETTEKLNKALKLINTKLIDHIIVGDNEYSSLAQSDLGESLFS